MALHSYFVPARHESSNPFPDNLKILLIVYYHLVWKLIISHDVMGKCVSFLNNFLPLWLCHHQSFLKLQPLFLLFIVGRVFIFLHIKFTGDRKKDSSPSSNLFCSQRLTRNKTAAGRQKLPASLPDACNVYGGKCPDSQLPWKGLLLRANLPWKMGNCAENTAQLPALLLWVKAIPGVPTYVWIVKSDLNPYLDRQQQGGSCAGVRIWGEEKATWPGSPALLSSWPLARKHLTVFFSPSLHTIFRHPICKGYDASLDMCTRLAITGSREHGAVGKARGKDHEKLDVSLALPLWSGGTPLPHSSYVLSRDSAVSFNCDITCETHWKSMKSLWL